METAGIFEIPNVRPLPAATAETMGSRQHPGPLCHQKAAEATAALPRELL